MKKINLDEEEKNILESFENDEWVSDFSEKDKILYQQYASATLLNKRKINLRVFENDLLAIKASAINAGIPYQTFISSILHKYATGQLKESPQ